VSLFAELKRRKVVRVAVVYAATAFAVLQAADIMLPQMGVPEWGLSLVVALTVLGFPIALVLGWALEVTPDGIKRTEAAPAETSDAATPALIGKRTVFAAALLVVLGVGIGAGWFLRPASVPEIAPAAEPVAALAADAPVVADKSIAVLPFADFSPGGDQAWFADGLTEEILNALARTPDLLVTARTSSFRYKGSTLDIPQIAAELGVAHVLEGSIRSTPQRIRVTAQLIRAADGFHLWSETYDRDPADMIEIQEDLARNIALAMQTTMDPQALADMAKVGTRSVEAYQAYIRGLASRWKGGGDSFKEGYELFEKARALDPGFAAAHAQAAHFWLTQLDVTAIEGGLTDLSPGETEARFRERIRLAVDAASTPVERAGYEASGAMLELRWRKAIGLYQEFLAARPGDAAAKQALFTLAIQANDRELLEQLLEASWPETRLRRDMAIFHTNQAHRSGNYPRAADQAVALLEWWPDDFEVLYQVHRALLWDGRVAVAAEVLERMERGARGDEQWGALPPARQACAEGRRGDAEQILANFDVDGISLRWHLLMLLGEQAAATDLLMEFERDGRTYALASFLVYPHFDPSPFPSLMRILEREQVRRPPPVALPFACPPRGPVS
jgi:TolB-like protein/thioredoxin-like negative regulator of GroEL